METREISTEKISRNQTSTILKAALIASLFHLIILFTGTLFFQREPVLEGDLTPQNQAREVIQLECPDWAGVWYHWDSLWIVHLSKNGYRIERNPDYSLAQSNVAFLPGLPLIARGLKNLGLNPWSSILLVNLISEFALIFGLGRLAVDLGLSTSGVKWAVIGFCCWPWHLFLIAPYQESVGIALLVWSIQLAHRGNWPVGFLLGLMASMFRLTALGLCAGLIAGSILLFVFGHRQKRTIALALGLLGVFAGWVLILYYFHLKFGDPQIGVKIQTTWGREMPAFHGPLRALATPFTQNLSGSAWLDWISAVIVLSMIPLTIRQLGLAWGMGLLILVAQSLSTGVVTSHGRYMLTAIPMFICFGSLAENWVKPAFFTCLAGLMIQILLLWRLGHGLFAG